MKKAIAIVSTLIVAMAFPVYALVDIGSSTAIDGIQTDQGNVISFGQSSSIQDTGIYYKPAASHNICNVSFLLYSNNGNATDALILELRLGTTTSSGGHSYDQGTRVQLADSHLQVRNTSATEKTFTFTPCAIVVGANEYFFSLYRDGSNDNTNYYRLLGRSASSTSYGTGAKNVFLAYNSGTFTKNN